jgi:hypothetical protein
MFQQRQKWTKSHQISSLGMYCCQKEWNDFLVSSSLGSAALHNQASLPTMLHASTHYAAAVESLELSEDYSATGGDVVLHQRMTPNNDTTGAPNCAPVDEKHESLKDDVTENLFLWDCNGGSLWEYAWHDATSNYMVGNLYDKGPKGSEKENKCKDLLKKGLPPGASWEDERFAKFAPEVARQRSGKRLSDVHKHCLVTGPTKLFSGIRQYFKDPAREPDELHGSFSPGPRLQIPSLCLLDPREDLILQVATVPFQPQLRQIEVHDEDGQGAAWWHCLPTMPFSRSAWKELRDRLKFVLRSKEARLRPSRRRIDRGQWPLIPRSASIIAGTFLFRIPRVYRQDNCCWLKNKDVCKSKFQYVVSEMLQLKVDDLPVEMGWCLWLCACNQSMGNDERIHMPDLAVSCVRLKRFVSAHRFPWFGCTRSNHLHHFVTIW